LKLFASILFALVSLSLSAQDGYYFTSTHNFNQYWKKFSADKTDSSVCNFEFNWTAFRGDHPLVAVLTKEAAALACLPFNDSCAGDSITENWVDRQSKSLKNDWLEVLKDTSNPMVYHDFYGELTAVENDSFVSLLLYMDVFTGGARPDNYHRYAVINRSDQKRIHSWESLFTDTAAMLRLGAAAFLEEYEPSQGADSTWFQEFFLPQNFYFDSVGMHFMYSSGDLTPPSYGPAILSFPFGKIDAFARVRLH
jgi:hypothetical protein